ncbi:hypothetical protein STAS_27769 [Striga asiatica]|uniref:Uncharacterized protein n=1 Tax=Striga asiatica TaxID=4170 RepID=A0A5A7R224_STRAF|nr:hypothetical protein STAS_27769 [Striga asiatica]
MCFVEAKLELPLPQDKPAIVEYKGSVWDERWHCKSAFFIPVLDQPLSSNRYYAIKATDENKGLAFTCSSREKDAAKWCCFRLVKDAKPRQLDPRDEGILGNYGVFRFYYGMTLERRWEKVFTCRNNGNDARVAVSGSFKNEVACVGESRAEWDYKKADCEGMIWYDSCGGSVGSRREIVERMRWEEELGVGGREEAGEGREGGRV